MSLWLNNSTRKEVSAALGDPVKSRLSALYASAYVGHGKLRFVTISRHTTGLVVQISSRESVQFAAARSN
jgi:hypothetical protein